MWWFVVTFVVGLAAGRVSFVPAALLHHTGRIITPCLLTLIILLGYEIGSNRKIVAQLPVMGAEALIICVLSMAGSALLGFVIWRATIKGRHDTTQSGLRGGRVSHRLTLLLLLAVATGILLGWLSHGSIHVPDPLENAIFSLLLFGVGLEVGREQAIVERVRKAGIKVLLLPVCVVVGTVLGSLVASLCVGMNTRLTLAIGSGFGWYSLAAVLLGHLQSPGAGALAFLANVMRELLSFFTIPLVTRKLGGYAAIAMSGATSMDTTLPVIVRESGSAFAIPSFLSGLIVSLFVPLAIPLFVNL